MEWQHPTFQQMVQLGCSNRLNVTLTFQTYMDLCEVQKLWDVQCYYLKEQNIIYLTAKEKKNVEKVVLYVTISAKDSVSPAWLCTVQKELEKLHPNSEFTLVIKAPDSTMSQYVVTRGLIPPLSPEASKEKKSLLEKQQYLKSEFNKMKHELYADAKNRNYDKQTDSDYTIT